MINKKEIKALAQKIYIKLNKPLEFVCTNRKFKNEKNIFDLVDVQEKLVVAGRLDKNSRGLVLLTNDGDLVQKLTHPKFEHEKEYLVKSHQVHKVKSDEVDIINIFIKGVDIGEGDGLVRAKRVERIGDNRFRIILTEGKKRQIRRMFRKVGWEVVDLKRVRIGDLELGNLGEGAWEYLENKKILFY